MVASGLSTRHTRGVTKPHKRSEGPGESGYPESAAGVLWRKLLADVIRVVPGGAEATIYHRAVEKLLTALLYPALDLPVIEQEIHDGGKRIDIRYTNIARKDFSTGCTTFTMSMHHTSLSSARTIQIS